MSSLIHTDDLEAGERFEFWRESVSETWVPMECFTDNETGFWAQVRTGGLGAVKVNLMTAAPHGVRQTRRLIRQADPDLLKVLILLSGDCVISQDDRQAHLGPADFVLYDTRRPYWARTVGADGRPIQALTFLFPRSLLPLPPGQLNRLTATRMAAGRGVGALTSEFLVQLARNLEHYRPAEATRLAPLRSRSWPPAWLTRATSSHPGCRPPIPARVQGPAAVAAGAEPVGISLISPVW